jgi:hypothetical protein
MTNFSKYLGKDERVLNSIDMKDETVWAQNNLAASEYKSWTTLVVTNKRFFSVSKRKLSMKEFRLEDVVSTGWVYHPQWGKIIWGIIYLILSALIYISAGTITDMLPISSVDAETIKLGLEIIAICIGLISILVFATYFLLKRTTFTVTTKDGKEYKFLLRGRRRHIDEFRMTIQDAKDLYIEETENRYFDKMRTVLFDQSNYEHALNNPKDVGIEANEQPKLQKEENLMIWERKNAQISGNDAKMISETTMSLASDGTLQLNTVGAYQLTADKTYLSESENGSESRKGDPLKSSEISAGGSLTEKASDLFEQIGFEVSVLNAEDADLLLFKDNLRYIVLVDKKEEPEITFPHIDKAIQSKNRYKTDFGIYISGGDLPGNVQEHAGKNNIKIIYIKKAE